MKTKTFAILFGFALAAAGLVQPARAAEKYTLDEIHSSIHLKVQHKGAGYVFGRFDDFSGSIDLDRQAPENSSIQVTVQAASVNTGFDKRDQHLRSPDFLNAKQFPTIDFRSTAVERTGENSAEVTGELTLLGRTATVTAQATHTGSQGDLVGFEARFTLKRSDWGMKFMVGPLGDEVELLILVEGKKD